MRERFARLGASLVTEEHAGIVQDELRAAEPRLGDMELRLHRATAAIAREREARRAAEAEAESLRVRVAGLLASNSWRVTAPLRALSAWLPRRARRTPAAPPPPLARAAAPPPSRIALPPVSTSAAPTHSVFALPGAPDQFARCAALNVVYIAGEPDTPGVLYRVVRQVEAARAVGAAAEWFRPEQIDASLPAIRAADVLVIWRAPWDDRIGRAIGAARANKARIALDVDDLIFEPNLAKLSIIDGIRSQDLTEAEVRDHYAHIRATLAAADICTCTTEELAAHLRAAGRPAMVLPNGFDQATHATARMAFRQRQVAADDGVVRLGYAGGSRTHQRDFGQAAEAIARVLHARPQCRLVLFRLMPWDTKLIDIEEFPALHALADRIEWRDMVTLPDLPTEIARFDINLAPLEVGNPFCEPKSELKYFEAALAGVATIASPSGPFVRAIRNGETGLLASDAAAWEAALLRLVDDPALRARMARDAYHDVLWRFGPQQRAAVMASFLAGARGPGSAAAAFAADCLRDSAAPPRQVPLPETETLWSTDRLEDAEVTVVIPLYNYAAYVAEALDSVAAQTLARLDLVVIDDCSTDDSLAVALAWTKAHQHRFNRLAILRNCTNAGLGPTRNAGFAAAETPFVLPLDADNRLLPDCAARCLDRIRESGAAFVYPQIRKFGESDEVIGTLPYHPVNLVSGNYIDAMALIAKAAWAAVGGYENVRLGWEDYDFWCRLAERGLWGLDAGAVLAEYRVHGQSMLNTVTDIAGNRRKLVADFERRHPWVRVSITEAASRRVEQASGDMAEN